MILIAIMRIFLGSYDAEMGFISGFCFKMATHFPVERLFSLDDSCKGLEKPYVVSDSSEGPLGITVLLGSDLVVVVEALGSCQWKFIFENGKVLGFFLPKLIIAVGVFYPRCVKLSSNLSVECFSLKLMGLYSITVYLRRATLVDRVASGVDPIGVLVNDFILYESIHDLVHCFDLQGNCKVLPASLLVVNDASLFVDGCFVFDIMPQWVLAGLMSNNNNVLTGLNLKRMELGMYKTWFRLDIRRVVCQFFEEWKHRSLELFGQGNIGFEFVIPVEENGWCYCIARNYSEAPTENYNFVSGFHGDYYQDEVSCCSVRNFWLCGDFCLLLDKGACYKVVELERSVEASYWGNCDRRNAKELVVWLGLDIQAEINGLDTNLEYGWGQKWQIVLQVVNLSAELCLIAGDNCLLVIDGQICDSQNMLRLDDLILIGCCNERNDGGSIMVVTEGVCQGNESLQHYVPVGYGNGVYNAVRYDNNDLEVAVRPRLLDVDVGCRTGNCIATVMRLVKLGIGLMCLGWESGGCCTYHMNLA